MSDAERSPVIKRAETGEEFMQHMEAGGNKIRGLALVSLVVAFLLVVSYVLELALPFTTNTRVVEVNLADPSLMVVEVFLIALGVAWLYLGFREYRFTTRLRKQIKEIRKLEQEIMAKAGLPEDERVSGA
jgi:hypothetical protein